MVHEGGHQPTRVAFQPHHAVDGPYHCIGVEGNAVGELQPLAQLEGVLQAVLADFVGLGQAGLQFGGAGDVLEEGIHSVVMDLPGVEVVGVSRVEVGYGVGGADNQRFNCRWLRRGRLGDVLAVPLHGELGQGAIGVHLRDDLVELGQELLARASRFVQSEGQGFVEGRITHQLDGHPFLDGVLQSGYGRHHSIQPNTVAQLQVLDGVGIGGVGPDLARLPRDIFDLIPWDGDNEVLPQEVFVGSFTSHTDDFACQVVHGLDGGVILVHSEPGWRVVVGIGEPEHLSAFLGRGHATDADVPAATPVASGDEVPVGGHELQLDT